MLSNIDFEVGVAIMLKKKILDQISTFEFSGVMYYIFIAVRVTKEKKQVRAKIQETHCGEIIYKILPLCANQQRKIIAICTQ